MGENFETGEQRKAIGLVAIHVDGILIPGSETFVEYITQRMKEKFESDRYGENEAIYLWMGIPTVNSEDSDGVVSGSDKYDGAINHIGIPHARTRTPQEPLGEAEQAHLRSELGKLMRIARIARPVVIYDALAAAQTFSDGEIIAFWKKAMEFWKTRKRVSGKRKRRKIAGAFLVLLNL